MKHTIFLTLLLSLVSCKKEINNTDLVHSNTYLIGTWSGTGALLKVDLNEEIGELELSVTIDSVGNISGKIGDAQFTGAELIKKDFGFVVQAPLIGKIKNNHPFEKAYINVLFELPEFNRDGITLTEGNFHLKSNLIFDFNMKVGGIILHKN
ncbi:MAG: hypothetical protein KDC83_09325 [Flavobacteriales bacterium]|nr:hypothetical protein [Flavobacteriales bacterium]